MVIHLTIQSTARLRRRTSKTALMITGEIANFAQDLFPFSVPDSLGTISMFERPTDVGIGGAHRIEAFCIVMEAAACQ